MTEVTHALLKHVCGEGQTWQLAPFLPHALLAVPGAQPASPTQPLQLPIMQVPAVQT